MALTLALTLVLIRVLAPTPTLVETPPSPLGTMQCSPNPTSDPNPDANPNHVSAARSLSLF